MASPPILGTEDHMLLQDPDLIEELAEFKGHLEDRNVSSQSRFVID
jgi:hypothetical protein